MKSFSKIFFWGLMISFLGSLPPGTMNIAATQVTAQQGQKAGILYAIGSMLAEVIIVRLALSGMRRLIRRHRVFYFLELLTAVLLLTMAIACFVAAVQMNDIAHILPGNAWHPFWTGVLISALNPLHLPFWLGWTTILMNKEILLPQAKMLNIYVCGIALGTILGFLTFIYTGHYLLTAFQDKQFEICVGGGFVMLTVSYFHIKRMILSPASIRYKKMINKIYQ
jgi:threonine/homoserine/homoserine lactone efflux protein